MAFLPDAQDQSTQSGQTQQAGQQVPQVPQIPTLQGTSGSNASSGSGTQTGSTNTSGGPGAAPQQPWQNITTYLSANAPNASNVAGSIANNLSSQYNQTYGDIGNTAQSFQGKISGADVPENTSLINSAKSDPTSFVQDPNNVQQFQKELNASYTGPQDFSHSSDYSNLQNEVLKGQQQAGLVNQGTSGLMTLLNQAEGNPSQGVSALDSLLLQENPSNFTTIKNAAAPFAGLTDYLNSTQTGLDSAAQKAANETAATSQDVQNQFNGQGGYIPTFQGKINQELQDTQNQAKGYNSEIADIQGKLANGQQLTEQELYDVDRTGGLAAFNGVFQNSLEFPGMAPGMLGQYYSLPANGMAQNPTLANSLTTKDYTDSQALNQLMGRDLNLAPMQQQHFQLPTDLGSFDDKAAMQGMLNSLNSDQGALPNMTPQQQQDYLRDTQWLMGALGQSSPTQPVINPIAPPTPVTPTLGGGVPNNPNPPPPTGGLGGVQSGGGHFAR